MVLDVPGFLIIILLLISILIFVMVLVSQRRERSNGLFSALMIFLLSSWAMSEIIEILLPAVAAIGFQVHFVSMVIFLVALVSHRLRITKYSIKKVQSK